MKKMILENIKWIFSGIGLVIIVGLWTYLRRKRKRKPESALAGSQAEAIKQSSSAGLDMTPPVQVIDPFEVVGIIKEAPILQQPDIGKHYEGIRVDWAGELDHIVKWEEIKLGVRILMWARGLPLRCALIEFNIDPKEYSGLGLLKKGDPIRVSGIIDNASSYGSTLKDAKLISYGSGQKKE